MLASSKYPKWGLIAVLLGLAGCATVQQPHRGHLASTDSTIRECAHWFRTLDSAVARASVGDRAARRVSGYPYLRIDRFTASFRDQSADNDVIRTAWFERMRNLDAAGRQIEIRNLPPSALENFATSNRSALLSRLRKCTAVLAAADSNGQIPQDLLLRRAYVADDYSLALRVFGFYELTRLPFYLGVSNWQANTARNFTAARRGHAPAQPLQRYRPPPTPGYSRAEVAAILARAARHPLGVVELSAAEKDRLFATYAPHFEFETGGDFDRIGTPYWSRTHRPQVDVSRPTVYRRIDLTRVGNRSLLQLVYTAWLPERPRDGPFDLLGGRLDGIVWRVTLAPDGEPVLYDSIHPCGCYHLFFPTPRVEPLPPPRSQQEWAFTPATLPRIKHGMRLTLSLRTRTHYLYNVKPDESNAGKVYRWADYDALRSLPLPDGGARSLFGPDGLVAGTERRERFLFWPMGIASAGAMRQAGTQATAFVGRRHFDDADLIEKRFRLLD